MSRVCARQWEFVYPDIYRELMGQFHAGCESLEQGDLQDSERAFKAVLSQMPDHLDAIHHLAMVQSGRGLEEEALDLWEQAVRIGRRAFPSDFELGRDRLEWGWLENRPFLRCLHGLALAQYEKGNVEEAVTLLQELLALNSNDNQGVRAVAIEALFRLGRLEEALKITERYSDDAMPETLYGRALVLFKLGHRREATIALKEAVRYLRLVRRELLKKSHRLPKSDKHSMVTLGGADEAYYYWERWGRFWGEESKAIEWLRGIVRPGEGRIGEGRQNPTG